MDEKDKLIQDLRRKIEALTEHDGCVGCVHDHEDESSFACSQCSHNYMDMYVKAPKKKRWETYEGDFEKALLDHNICCENGHEIMDYETMGCGTLSCRGCFARWLMEEVEVEANEEVY